MTTREKIIEQHLKDMGITEKGMSLGKELFLAILPIVEKLEKENCGCDYIRDFCQSVVVSVVMRKGSSRNLKF